MTEDTTLTATGQLTATDVDHLATQSWAIFDSVHGTMVSTLSGTYGSLSVDSNTGEWTYTLANGTNGTAGAVQSLAAGEQHDEVFSVVVTDDQGATVTQSVTITVKGTNDAPVIDLDGAVVGVTATLAYTENDLDTAIAPSATVADIDSSNFNGGSLTVTFTANGHAEDQLTVLTGGGVTLNSGIVSVGGVPIGTLDGTHHGADGDNLKINFNAAATSSTVTTLMQHIGYSNNSDNPDTGARTVEFKVIDGSGTANDTTQVTATINITAVDDAPVAAADTITNDTPPSTANGWVLNTDNGHYYRYSADVGVTWTQAQSAAITDGVYLATITDANEQAFVEQLIGGNGHYAWLGGYSSDPTNKASWSWTGGPEQNAHFSYDHWNPVYGEPNGFPPYLDAGLIINKDGTWNDVPPIDFSENFGNFRYVEEWGGQAGQVVFREDTGTTLTTQQLLANDTDIDTPHASLTVTGVSNGAHGTVSLNGNIVTYHPTADYNGADSFTYTLFDGSLTSTGTVSFNVAAVNDAPVLDLDGPTTVSSGYNGGSITNNGSFAAPIADSSMTIADVDNSTMASATVVLTDGQSGDYFYVPGSGTINGIAWSISGVAGTADPLTITFTGPAANADFAYAIQQVSFGSNGGGAGDRHIAVAVNDGTDNSNITTATISVTDAGGSVPPVANDDTLNIYGVSNLLFAAGGSLTSNDSDPGDTFAISGAAHGSSTDTPDSEGIMRVAGTFGTLFLFATDHPNSFTVGLINVPGGSAGEYRFAIGYGVDGNPLAGNLIDSLRAGDAPLVDHFQYTITDSHGVTSAPADFTVTYDINPIVETVRTNSGYDTTTLWTDMNVGILGTYDANHLTLVNGNHTVTIDTTGLTWNMISGGIELTGGVVNAIHVTDSTFGAALDLINLNTYATDFYAAVGPSGSQIAYDNLFNTRAFDIHGGSGNDVLKGFDFNDRIDTGGGADIVNAGAGNDVIIVHENSGWQIDGGTGVDTLKFDGHFDIINGAPNQSIANVEIIDLNTTNANVIAADAEGVAEANADHTVRFLGDGQDRVALVNSFFGHESGHWGLENRTATYSGDHITDGLTFTEYAFTDFDVNSNTYVTYATAFVQSSVAVNVGVLNSDQVTTDEGMTGTTTVFGTHLNDVNQAAQYKVSADAQYGSVTALGPGGITVALDDPSHVVVASVSDINDGFMAGVTYTPYVAPDDNNGELYDTVKLTVTDTVHQVEDTMNFVFRLQGNGPATLVGTNDKDVIFGTENGDTMSGLGGKDNFVFTDTLVGSGADTITDYQSGTDHIVLNNFGNLFGGNFNAWLAANVEDTTGGALVHILDVNNVSSSITLTGVVKASLSANDFILHPGTPPIGM